MTGLTRVRRESGSSSNPFAGEDGAESIGVVASSSKGSAFLCLRRVDGGDGGGLGGRCCF
jgi:hypothetical protein